MEKIIHKGGITWQDSYSNVLQFCLTWEAYCKSMSQGWACKNFQLLEDKKQISYCLLTFDVGGECVVIDYTGGIGSLSRWIGKYKVKGIGKLGVDNRSEFMILEGEDGKEKSVKNGDTVLPMNLFLTEIKQKLNPNTYSELPSWSWKELGLKRNSEMTLWEKIDRWLWLILIPDEPWFWIYIILMFIRIWMAYYEDIMLLIIIIYGGVYVGVNLLFKKLKGYW